MCLVTFYTYSCCKRPYLDASPESHCSRYWPAEKCIGQYVTPQGVPANLPKRIGVCWRCLAKKNGVPEVDAEASRPDLDHAKLYDPTKHKGPTYGDISRMRRSKGKGSGNVNGRARGRDGGRSASMVTSWSGITKEHSTPAIGRSTRSRPQRSHSKRRKTFQEAGKKPRSPHRDWSQYYQEEKSGLWRPFTSDSYAKYQLSVESASRTHLEPSIQPEVLSTQLQQWTSSEHQLVAMPNYDLQYANAPYHDHSSSGLTDAPLPSVSEQSGECIFNPYEMSHYPEGILQPPPMYYTNEERIALGFHDELGGEMNPAGAHGDGIFIQPQQGMHDPFTDPSGQHIPPLPMYGHNADVVPTPKIMPDTVRPNADSSMPQLELPEPSLAE
jgi:hypothetical protein